MPTELRDTGINALGKIPWGTHLCLFYETDDDLIDTAVPYFKSGLDNNEFCLWVVSELQSGQTATDMLQAAIPGLDQRIAAGDIQIVPQTEWYMKDGTFDPDRTIKRWGETLADAQTRGYAGMRVLAKEAWLDQRHWKDFVKYERQLDDQIGDQRMIVLCAYPLAGFGATEILDVSGTHQLALAKRRGVWDVFETPGLKQSKNEINRINEELEKRVTERTEELARINEILRNEITERKKAEFALRKQKEILQTIFDNVPVMFNFVSADGTFELVNREWERVLGWSLKDIHEQHLDIIAECYPDPHQYQEVREFISNSNGEWRDFKATVRNGQVIDTSWAIVHLSDGTAIGIGQDISDRKRREEQLEATSEQLRVLIGSFRRAREEEGTRIARELHDELGSALTSLKWDLDVIDKSISTADQQLGIQPMRERVATMTQLIDETINAVRRISSELRPGILDDLGLVAAIEWQAQQFEARTGIVCQFDSLVEEIDLTPDQSTAVFRILQEALTNVLRHAQATKVNIIIEVEDGELVLKIADSGRGITQAESSGTQSPGLIGMRERAQLAGGRIEIVGVSGKGTTLTVSVPIRKNL